MMRRKGARLERVMGIEPTLSAWEAEVLPLNYTRNQPVTYHASLNEHKVPAPPDGLSSPSVGSVIHWRFCFGELEQHGEAFSLSR
jgi:hypothetical protein